MTSQLKISKHEGHYLFNQGKDELRVDIESKPHGHVAILSLINGQEFNESNLAHPLLFTADAYLRAETNSWTLIQWKEDQLNFPLFESLANLPQFNDEGIIVHEEDRYDGPISGVIDLAGKFYWFEWCMGAIAEDNFHSGPRIFSLRKIPDSENDFLLSWSTKEKDLAAEFRVIANPHIYPVSEWQRLQMRTLEDVQKEMEIHNLPIEKLKNASICAWIDSGVCSSSFAAIQVVYLSQSESENFQKWQRDVALALKSENQTNIDEVFARQTHTRNELEIYRFDKTDDSGHRRIILRDYKGQPLPENFWMTGHHRIQDYSYL